jgi:AbrB family looped-hinge helix DNA binding protein
MQYKQNIYIIFLTYLTIKKNKMQEEIKDIRIVTLTKKGQICIPNVARNLVGFKEGVKISIVVYLDRVELKPMKNEELNDALFCMLASEEVLAKN